MKAVYIVGSIIVLVFLSFAIYSSFSLNSNFSLDSGTSVGILGIVYLIFSIYIVIERSLFYQRAQDKYSLYSGLGLIVLFIIFLIVASSQDAGILVAIPLGVVLSMPLFFFGVLLGRIYKKIFGRT